MLSEGVWSLATQSHHDRAPGLKVPEIRSVFALSAQAVDKLAESFGAQAPDAAPELAPYAHGVHLSMKLADFPICNEKHTYRA